MFDFNLKSNVEKNKIDFAVFLV